MGEAVAKLTCNYQACPVDCRWAEWTFWSDCTKTCDKGTRFRSRQRLEAAQHGGAICRGDAFEEPYCNRKECPVDCAWHPWEEWAPCSESCGGGNRMRVREKKVEPAFGGLACDGGYKESKVCGQWACPVDCKWGEWSPWAQCSRSCGGGKRSRSRGVQIPGQAGGSQCRGETVTYQWCMTNPCVGDYVGMSGQLAEEEGVEEEEAKVKAESGASGPSEEDIAEAASARNTKFMLAAIVIIGVGVAVLIPMLQHFADSAKTAKKEGGGAEEGGEAEEDEDEE